MYQYSFFDKKISIIDNNVRQYNQHTLTSNQIDYVIPEGKHAKFSVNKLYQYNTSLVAKFYGANKPAVPMIVFYIDSTTSFKSREFIDTILKSQKFSKTIGDVSVTPNALYMVLDRASASPEQLSDFRSKFTNGSSINSFPLVVVYYNGIIKVNSFQALFQ